MSSVYITQGEHAVGRDQDMVITTILGSCVSVCLWDPVAKVGGMNHLLLPDMKQDNANVTAGAADMDLLINRMLPHGAERSRLRAKLFGGSSMLRGRTDIGSRNIEFGRRYLKTEGIPCDAEDVGGTDARRLKFWPASGVARMLRVKNTIPEPEVEKPANGNDVELF